ncbi:MAG TPA: FAD-linked oxidase C-terminal domain-containing protein [Pyrinomonadaceae bacterium]|nr:FAD-linked oxidase C-terminal domain-containing protein [Pyrinomonadaceae bacterium]
MDQLIENLRAIVGRENVLAERDELLVYECDGLTQHKHLPRAVVFPSSTGEVAAVVRELASAGVSFAPRGAGTGLSGGALAVGRGVIVELSRMRRLLKLDVENRIAVIETGMVNEQVSRAVAAHGLYYVPDPSSGRTCTVGGNIAENAGGIHCLKYGVTTDHVLAARVVLSDGQVIDLGGAAGAAGYDLLGVFVGSEGTFGIATEATVRLAPLPQAVRTLLADFAEVDDASRAVSAIIAEGLIPAALEMMDGATIRAVEASVFAAGLPRDAGAALLIELDGLEAGLEDEARRAESICCEHGARGVRRATDERERKKLWAARKGAFGAMGRLAPDMMIQDAVVPRSRLPEILAETYRVSSEYRLKLANVFHAGDGNLHPFISFDRRDADELRRVEEAGREIMQACVRAGGTITGEHGVGLDKSAYLPLIFSDDDLDAMLSVRAAFDPSSLCNPGKIIPAPRGCGEARAVAAATAQTATREVGGRNGDASAERGAGRVSTPPRFEEPEEAATSASSPTRFRRKPGLSHGARGVDEIGQLFTRALGGECVEARSGAVAVLPSSAEEACEGMKIAAREGLASYPSGAGLWLGRRRGTSTGQRVAISTRRLSRIVEHSPADLVVTAEAGVPLSSLNAEVSRSGQWLPLDPPDDGRATVGGVVATGMGGALSAACGPPRAHLLGVRAVLADGRAIRAGGRVVKNVAGYDLAKLFAGSRGTLCLLTELTFKLRPRPARDATLVARAEEAAGLFAAARRLHGERLLPAAVELLSPRAASRLDPDDAGGHLLLVRFAGTNAAVGWQVGRALSLLSAEKLSAPPEVSEDAARLWESVAALPLRGGRKLCWRASALPSHLPELLARLKDASARDDSLAWHAGVAAGSLRATHELIEGSEGLTTLLSELREIARHGGGSLVIEEADEEAGAALATAGFDVWGVEEGASRLMRAVKGALDPRGLLSPGVF